MGRKEGKFRAIPRSGTSIQGPPLPTAPTTSNISQEGVSWRIHNSGNKKMDPEETDQNQIVY